MASNPEKIPLSTSIPTIQSVANIRSVNENSGSEFVPLNLLNESLWHRLRSGFEFSSIDNARVDEQIRFLQAGQRSLSSNLTDASPYLFHITEQLQRSGLPIDIALLPLIESGFNPTALSEESAVGIWQFIPATARHYGLVVGKHYDQRKDVFASTTAAISYLSDLVYMFDGDWLLALAAYNTGPGNVRSAMHKAAKQGKETNYWNLKLSTETSNYVPRLIAATKIISDPDKYGSTLPPLANRKQIESISVGRRISLAQVSELTDIPIAQAKKLNSSLHKGLTPANGPHVLTLPVEAAQHLLWSLNQMKREPLISDQGQTSLVRQSDSYQGDSYQGDTDAFIIDSNTDLQGHHANFKRYAPYKTYHYKTHIVEHGDSLWKVARKLNVSVNTLREWNDLHEGEQNIQIGDELKVAYLGIENIDLEKEKLMRYRVSPRDTLVSIADKFDLHIGEIKKWNQALWYVNRVKSGQILQIPTQTSQ